VNKKYNNIIQLILIWCTSIILSLSIGIGVIFLVIEIIGNYYESINPLVPGEKDLAYGLIMMFWFCLVTALTIPLVIFFTILLKRLIFKHFKQNKR
jgi:hypothetical protein